MLYLCTFKTLYRDSHPLSTKAKAFKKYKSYMVSVDGLTVEFGGTTLFKDISFVINDKDRIALMGKNGAGKSTLLKILAGVRQASRGSVSAPKDTTIAYLPQHLMTEDGRTVFEEASQAFAHLHKMEAEIEAINKQLAERTDYESDEYMALIEQVATMSEKFYAIDMTHFEEDVEKRCSDWDSNARTSTVRRRSFLADGACVSNWPRCCCKIPTYCSSTNRRTTSTSRVSDGWKISSSRVARPWW